MVHRLTRRKFLKTLTLAGSALYLSNCTRAIPATPTSSLPNQAAGSPGVDERERVVLARASTYNAGKLRKTLEKMAEQLGGLADVVKPGMRVGIKLNLVGGPWWDAPGKPPATEYFVSHPAVAGALAEILFDLGASQVILMDGLGANQATLESGFGDASIFNQWGYRDLANRLGVLLLDLNRPAPYKDFTVFPVGENSLVYSEFSLNPILQELDVFVSMAKMKCHTTAGVTLALKNLIGLPPLSLYRRQESDYNRTALHGETAFDTRLPRVVVDLNRARPIHLALVDGIRTAEGGEGPWNTNLNPVRPGLLALGKSPLAVDTLCTAVMGFDPQAPGGDSPFVGSDNYLELAQQAGLGSNRLADIRVEGLSLEEALFPFKPAR